MKKIISGIGCFVLCLVLASCAKDEILEVQTGSGITFRTLYEGQTKALDLNAGNLESFNVSAFRTGSDSPIYMNNVTVNKVAMSWLYEPVQFWPQSGTLDFYAFAPINGTGIIRGDASTLEGNKTFTVTTERNPGNQIDLIFATAMAQNKENAGSGVALEFKHAMSELAINVSNSNDALEFEITGWKVVKYAERGTFKYSGTTESGKLSTDDWSFDSEDSPNVEIQSTDALQEAVSISGKSTAGALAGSTQMILIPQSVQAATAYSGAEGSALNGSYIALEMKICNKEDHSTVVDKTWCCWPVAFNWKPGYRYTYSVDIAGGGYYETNPNSGSSLAPTLDAPVTFVEVNVDETWLETSNDIFQQGLQLNMIYEYNITKTL